MNQAVKTLASKTTKAPTLYETENDLPQVARTKLITLINQRLADAIDLETQLRQADSQAAK